MFNNLQIGYGQSPPIQPQVVAASATSGGPSIPNVRLSFITLADQVKFENLYIQGVAGGKYLTGEGARGILLRSQLPADALAKIWTLSNVTGNEHLTFPEFALAMYLTNLKLKGQELPNKLHEDIFNEVKGAVDQVKAIEQKQQQEQPLQPPQPQQYIPIQQSNSPQMMQQQISGLAMVPSVSQYSFIPDTSGVSVMPGMLPFTQRMMPQQNPQQQYSTTGLQGNAKIPWAVTPEEKIQYRTIFRQWDSTGLGYLTGEKAREILSQSGLPKSDLMQIWNLSDPNNNGKLNQDEFAVAMHLIYRRLNGYDIPVTLPPELIPPSSRELNESLDKIKSILNSDAHNTQALLNSQPGAQYVKSRSFTSTPTVEYNDAVVYKHKDDDVGYVSAARHRVPSVPRDRSPSYSSLSTSSLSESGDRDDLSGKLSRLKKEIHEKQILLEALSYSAKSGPTSYDRSYSSNASDIDDYKFKIKELQRKIVDLQNSTPEWLSREFVKNTDELNSLMDQHRNLDYEFNNMLSSIVPDLIHKVRETNSKVATAKLELFKIRDERDGGSKIIGTGPGGSITEADKIKAKAQAMLQDRMARMTGKSHNFGSGISDSSSSRRYDDEVAKVSSEKEIREREVADIERNISRLQDSLIRIVKEREEIEDKLRQIEINTQSYESDARKWEDGIGVGEEVRRFIDDLKRDAPKSSYRTEYTQNNYSYDGIKYNESRYSSTGNESYDHSRPISSSSYSSVSSVSSSVQSSNAKTPGERSAFIEAEAKRRMQERLKAFGIDNPAPAPTPPSDSSTMIDRLIRERADTAERLERAGREAAERERIREQKLLAEKQKKAELEADRLKKLEEFKRQEEERADTAERLERAEREAVERERIREQKLLAEKQKKAELEADRLRKLEEFKRQEEERAERFERAELEAAERERIREQKLLAEKQKKAELEADRLRKLEEFKRQEEETSNIPSAPPLPPSSNIPSAPPLPPSSNIPSAPPLPPSNIPLAPPLPPSSSNIPSAPPLPPPASNIPIESSVSSQPQTPMQPSGGRSALLSQIQQGKKLKPTKTNDRSSPLAAGRANTSPSTTGPSSDASVPSAGPMGLGALFAGGIPKLQSRGAVETGRSATEDTRPTSSPRQRTILKADRRISADLFGSLASDQLASEGKLSTPTTPDITHTTSSESKEYLPSANESSSLVESPTTTSSSETDVNFTQEFRVKSLYSYPGTGGIDDLPFEAGITFLAHPSKTQSNADWWYGVIEQTGAKGWFPKSYVELFKEEKEICKAKVLFEWRAQTPDQLDIKQGTIVSILDKSLGDWWKAEYEGTKGIIPANYVEEISSYSGQNKLDKDMTGEDETSNDDTSEDETNENNGDIRPKSDIANNSNSDNNFDIFFTDPITIPKFSIQSPKNASFIKSPLEINSRSASPEPTEFVRSPSPTRLFGSSPIITVPWMQGMHVGSFKRERNNSTDSSLNPQNMPHQRPESPASACQGPSIPLWAGIIDPKILESISKEERKRQEAIYELITTEQIYLRDLQMIIKLFYGPLQNFLSEQELSTLFCNIQDILICNTTILSDLEQRQEEDAYFVSKVGDILLKHSENLTIYTKYCGNQLNASKFLQKKSSADKKFADFLKKSQQDPQLGSLDLSSFLLKPLQRITRYPLLIRQILHYTSKDNIDHQNMMQALHKAEKILEETNEAAREQENRLKLNEITNLVELESLEEKLDLTSMTRLVGKRQFILEGPLKKAKSGRNLYSYLFNDILLLCYSNKKATAKGHKYSLYKPPIPLNEIFVKDKEIGLDETCFQVVHIQDVINLRANNVSVKRQWVNQLETASGYCLEVERKIQKGENSSSPMDHNRISGTLRVLVYDGVVPSENGSEKFIEKFNINAYCQVQLNRQVFKTKIVKGNTFPQWNQNLMFSVITLEDTLKFSLFNFDNKYTTDEYLGQAEIGLHFLTHYGDNETGQITLKLKDIPPGRSPGSVSFYLSYKATD